MNFLFSFIFLLDIAATVFLSMFVNLTVGIVTGAVLLFINGITFYYILKMKEKIEQGKK